MASTHSSGKDIKRLLLQLVALILVSTPRSKPITIDEDLGMFI